MQLPIGLLYFETDNELNSIQLVIFARCPKHSISAKLLLQVAVYTVTIDA